MALHEGMNADDMTQTAGPVPGPAVVGHIAGDIFAAFKEVAGVPPGDPETKLTELSKRIASAVVLEIKNHAKITITVDAGPPISATATIE